MDCSEVNKAAQFAASGGGYRLVRRKVDRMQDVAEHLVLDRREKAKVAVHDPFPPRAEAILRHDSGVQHRQLPEPLTRPRSFPGRGEPSANEERRFGF